ncbi:NADH-quinone oxidoreductase subunit A [Prauserella muralis]|uniref:NADH-quinone oxidoreductase subunit n=1 Tax=Prauserella muralis TaxID=588067 RepID=A0A2V4AIN8_9PSEU|nr:NADH-quinone oxidoreductase subunit A [Prauserella muralis]PXY19046.1 NADH-quinone oxidoreductase subunit I [Prauserella muralis]
MGGFGGALLVVALVAGVLGALYGGALLVRLGRTVTGTRPFLSGHDPAEHAVSRFHVRWYTLTMIFLAFDMEMVFMYPWALVVAELGTKAVIEMFVFLAVLMAGVVYAWREGALRWT